VTTLDEQIQGEQRAKKSRWFRYAGISTGVIFAIGLVWGVILMLPASPMREVAPVTPFPVASTGMISAAPTGVTLSAAPTGALGGESTLFSAEDRSRLQQLLSETNNQVNALVTDPLLNAWQQATVFQLQTDMQQAYQWYGQQKYAETAALLPVIQQQAQAHIDAFHAAYQQAHSAAMQAFEQADLAQVTIHNNRTLAIHPQYPPAVQLQQRLAVAADVQVLWEQVRVAELENNTAKQQTLLTQISQLDAADIRAQARLASLKGASQQQAFQRALTQAITAIENQRYADARQALTVAKGIAPNRPELQEIQQQLARAEQQEGVQSALEQINVFRAADEWPTVLLLANKALSVAPDHPELQQVRQVAEQIVAVSEKLARFLRQPERLTDNNIQQLAAQAITEADALNPYSAKLATLQTQLHAQLTIKQQPVAVRITSDNRTTIRVLGVGNVGEVKEKTLQLAPGTYQFEGVCKGYRTEIVTVAVHADNAPIDVAVQCKVRI